MAFDPDAFIKSAPAPAPAPAATAAPAFDPDAFIKEPASGGAFAAKELPTEMRLKAENLRALLNARNGSYTERMTDWLIPGAKNVLGGMASAAGGLVPGSEGTLGERWRAGVEAEKQFRKQNREETAGPLGYATDAVGILGSMGKAPSSVAGAGAAVPGATVSTGEKVGTGVLNAAKTGGILGGVSGAAENAQSPTDAIKGGIVGGSVGAVAGATTQALIGRLLAGKAAAAQREATRGPSPESYFKQAGDKFKELDAAGIQFDQGQARRLGGMLPQTLKDANYTATAAPELADALKAVYTAGAKGKPPLTFTELQALRGKVQAAGESDATKPNLRRIANRVTGMIDDFVEKNAPNINQTGADLNKLWPEARKLWRTGLLGETVQDIESIAANKAATSGSNASDLERKAIANQANKDIRTGSSQLSPAAQEARQAVIEGSPKLETANRVAKSWPVQAGLGMLSAGAGSAMGLPHLGIAGTTVIGPGIARGIGGAAKHFADKNTANNMDALVRAIMTGNADVPKNWDMSRNMLARLLANKATQAGAGEAAAGRVKRREQQP